MDVKIYILKYFSLSGSKIRGVDGKRSILLNEPFIKEQNRLNEVSSKRI